MLYRPVTHGGVVVLSVVAIFTGSVFGRSQVTAQNLVGNKEAVLSASSTSETKIPTNRPRSEIVNYDVNSGDTLTAVAQKFGVSIETIKWANNLEDVDSLAPGDKLKIPPVTGVVYKVKDNDTLEAIAKKYSADAQTILDFPFNDISDDLSLKAGQDLVVPNGIVPAPPKPKPTPVSGQYAKVVPSTSVKGGSGIFSWPTNNSKGISQYASWWHPGAIDIPNDIGTPIYAADSGRVIVSQKLWYGYGWHVIIDHGNSYTSLYGHMSEIDVSVGQNVSKGQLVGLMGSTGRSTGPHLHFEVRKNGSPVDPLTVLP
ncbi:MAG: peptidoglycan DD-metalloendopeptidase family protein [Patescibacteria group bacterium]|nr:peptidoglycan DD-metalloendopeptidase family protein [Patescibacteria group bacterium]